jgi:hypothetical protein
MPSTGSTSRQLGAAEAAVGRIEAPLMLGTSSISGAGPPLSGGAADS